MPGDLLKQLEHAVEGLLYPSERDVPFTAFDWTSTTSAAPNARAALEANVQIPPGAAIEQQAIDDFFEELTEAEQAEGFSQLHKFLTATLTDLRVFRIGAVHVDIYILGRTPRASWAGLHTYAIET